LLAPYNFLFDRDVSKAVLLLSKKRSRTVSDVRLPDNATDASVVAKAWELDATIVTANGDDFLREMSAFSRQTKKSECHDLFGLVILPSGFEIQKRVLPRLDDRLRFKGKAISWKEVQRQNLCVRVKADGGFPTITQLPQCFYCEKLDGK
jgi:hypothetical protein